jgi:hypothetical protein
MPWYRLYLRYTGDHGIARGVDIECRDDDHAKQVAAQHRENHDVELWQAGRYVASFPKLKPGPVQG